MTLANGEAAATRQLSLVLINNLINVFQSPPEFQGVFFIALEKRDSAPETEVTKLKSAGLLAGLEALPRGGSNCALTTYASFPVQGEHKVYLPFLCTKKSLCCFDTIQLYLSGTWIKCYSD